MRLVVTTCCLLFCYFTTLLAQEDYESWQKKEQAKLDKYISEEDSKFVGFLKQEWKLQDVKEGAKPFEKPKPTKPPVVPEKKESPQDKVKDKQPIIHKDILVPPVKTKEVKKEDDIQFNLPIPKKNLHKLEFFNLLLPVSYSNELSVDITGPINNETIAECWKNLSSTNYKECLEQTILLREKLKLNDWGYAKLLFDTGKKINNGRLNESNLFTWYMLIKSGYKAKVGYDNNTIYLIIPSVNKLFGVPFFSFRDSETKYYVLSFDNKNITAEEIYTYNKDYPNVEKTFSFSMENLPDLGTQYKERQISFKYMGKENVIPLKYNDGLIKFFKNYPYTDLQVYFKSPLSPIAESSLINSLKTQTSSLDEQDALNYLLRFVQYATGYKVDNDQFGFEKPLFPEESLFYKYSDCEDRSIFFSYIVRKVLGLQVVGLDYPDHVATAVKLSKTVDGDNINYKNVTYLICDPTYLGASIGTAMPVYKNVKPGIIEGF